MRRTLYRWVMALGLGLVIVAPAVERGGVAWAASAAIDEARRLYTDAKFGEAIERLRGAVAAGELKGRDALRGKELLGRCLVKSGDRLEAREAFKSLLRQSPAWRLDRDAPPDEREVFEQAAHELNAEQIEAGNRVPASIAFAFGAGSSRNKNLAAMPHAGGGPDHYDGKSSFGGSVRFPLRPRLSLDIEIQRFRATAKDTFPVDRGGRYEATAMPIAVSAYYAAIARTHWRANAFLGLGPLFAGTSTIHFQLGTTPVAIEDERVGLYGHAGLEGELLLTPRFSISGRVLGRIAQASHLYKDADRNLKIYGTTTLKDRKLDFSGFGAQVGVRAYIGY